MTKVLDHLFINSNVFIENSKLFKFFVQVAGQCDTFAMSPEGMEALINVLGSIIGPLVLGSIVRIYVGL